jgi:Flp pilus assembly protein TadG
MACPRIGRRGIAAAELALVAPVLMTLMLCVHDLADGFQVSIRLERAARAGAQVAMSGTTDLAAVQSAVISAWPALSTNDVPLPVLSCECGTSAVSCTATCASGMIRTVTVRATRNLSPLLLKSYSQGVGHAVARLN